MRNMTIAGIIIVLLGLFLFMAGGAMTNDDPGVERSHLTFIVLGFVLVIAGGVVLAIGIL